MNHRNGAEEREDRRGVIVVSALAIISARKVDFASAFVRGLRSEVQSVENPILDRIELGKIMDKVVRIVANLDWRLFVTKREELQERLNPKTQLEDLNREGIWARIREGLPNLEVFNKRVRLTPSE